MKKFLFLLLFNFLTFSLHTADNKPNLSPKTLPQALWTVMGNTHVDLKPGKNTVALAFWAKLKPDYVYLRIENKEEGNIKGYDSAFDRTVALAALRNGSFINLYKASPTAPSIQSKAKMLNQAAEIAFKGLNQETSRELCAFCNQVEQQLDLVERGVAVPANRRTLVTECPIS